MVEVIRVVGVSWVVGMVEVTLVFRAVEVIMVVEVVVGSTFS